MCCVLKDDLGAMEELSKKGSLKNCLWNEYDLLLHLLNYPRCLFPIDISDYSDEHMYALFKIIVAYKPRLVTDLAVRVAAEQGHLHMVPHMLRMLPIIRTKAIAIILEEFEGWFQTREQGELKSFVKNFIRSVKRLSLARECRDIRHHIFLFLLISCSTELLAVLFEESRAVGVPVSQWRADLLEFMITVEASVTSEVDFWHRSMKMGSTGAISVLLLQRHPLERHERDPQHTSTLDILKTLIEQGQQVEASSFEALLCSRKTIDYFKPETSSAQCLDLLLQQYCKQNSDLSHPQLVRVLARVASRQPAAVFCLLKEGMPGAALLDTFDRRHFLPFSHHRLDDSKTSLSNR